jgi:hypothetical protein
MLLSLTVLTRLSSAGKALATSFNMTSSWAPFWPGPSTTIDKNECVCVCICV